MKMESRGGEACELQQLVSSDAENDGEEANTEDYTVSEEKVMSPVRSYKMSTSGNTSHSSVSKSNLGTNSNTRLVYINEKRSGFEPLRPNSSRPRNAHKESQGCVRHHCFLSEVPDVRHMERALLGLLADFHSGKLRAFGKGCTMERMTDIREQQEKLARLHFDLGAAFEPNVTEDGVRNANSNMTQLIQRLQQLSVSIEGLHSSTDM